MYECVVRMDGWPLIFEHTLLFVSSTHSTCPPSSLATMLDTKQYYYRGDPFTQFFQRVPALEPFYTDFEKNYDVVSMHSISPLSSR